MIGLYFDGCCNFFTELPPPDKIAELKPFYNLIESYKKPEEDKPTNTDSINYVF